MADRPYSGFSKSSEWTTKRMIRGADIGARVGTVIMPYIRQGLPMRKTNAGGRNLLFLCAPRKWLGLSVWMEMDLALVWGSKLTLFLCAGRKWLVFSVRIDWLGYCVGGRNWLSFCVRPENDMVLCGYWNWLGYCVGCRNWFDVSVGNRLTWFQWRDRNWLGFLRWGRKLFGFSFWIEIVFVSGHLTWFDF